MRVRGTIDSLRVVPLRSREPFGFVSSRAFVVSLLLRMIFSIKPANGPSVAGAATLPQRSRLRCSLGNSGGEQGSVISRLPTGRRHRLRHRIATRVAFEQTQAHSIHGRAHESRASEAERIGAMPGVRKKLAARECDRPLERASSWRVINAAQESRAMAKVSTLVAAIVVVTAAAFAITSGAQAKGGGGHGRRRWRTPCRRPRQSPFRWWPASFSRASGVLPARIPPPAARPRGAPRRAIHDARPARMAGAVYDRTRRFRAGSCGALVRSAAGQGGSPCRPRRLLPGTTAHPRRRVAGTVLLVLWGRRCLLAHGL